jgi:uncharacterized lipoprotein
MNKLKLLLVAMASFAFAGCGGNRTCEEPELYESAKPGQRITVPDDLDPPQEQKELTIPDAAPREARAENAGCLDEPPTLSTE